MVGDADFVESPFDAVPLPDPETVKESLEAYRRGDWRPIQEIIDELEGNGA